MRFIKFNLSMFPRQSHSQRFKTAVGILLNSISVNLTDYIKDFI